MFPGYEAYDYGIFTKSDCVEQIAEMRIDRFSVLRNEFRSYIRGNPQTPVRIIGTYP